MLPPAADEMSGLPKLAVMLPLLSYKIEAAVKTFVCNLSGDSTRSKKSCRGALVTVESASPVYQQSIGSYLVYKTDSEQSAVAANFGATKRWAY